MSIQNNVSMCKIQPKVVETQQKLKCGKHAINNLLQKKNFATCKTLEQMSKTISMLYDINFNELMNSSGYYDISVITFFFINNNFRVKQLNKTSYKSIKTTNKLIGYIVGDGNHWVSIRKETDTTNKNYCFFLIDSLYKKSLYIKLIPWMTKFYKKVNNNKTAILQVFEA